MSMFGLPKSTVVNRFLPKNSFDSYTNTRQKKKFSDLVQRITWLNKLAKETINLGGKDVIEIQVFGVELKNKKKIEDLLLIIDRAIPYNIVFVISFKDELYLSAAVKHAHPLNPNKAVVDYTFESNWMKQEELTYKFVLRNSLDDVFNHFCKQIDSHQTAEGDAVTQKDIKEVIKQRQEIEQLERTLNLLKLQIRNAPQFNIQVELNQKRHKVQQKLDKLKNR